MACTPELAAILVQRRVASEPECNDAIWSDIIANDGISSRMEEHPECLRQLVRQGIPHRFRWRVWRTALLLDASAHQPCPDLQALSHELSSGKETQTTSRRCSRQIDADLHRTFPEEPAFGVVQQARLGCVLKAYARYEPNVGYCQGMNFVAGFLLLVSRSEEETFLALNQLMEEHCLSGFYVQGFPLLIQYCDACLQLTKDKLPGLHGHFRSTQFLYSQYLCPWLMSLFVKLLPLSVAARFWDIIVWEGLPAVVPLAISVLRACEPFLLFLDNCDMGRFFELIKMSNKVTRPTYLVRIAPAASSLAATSSSLRSSSWELFWDNLFMMHIAAHYAADRSDSINLMRTGPQEFGCSTPENLDLTHAATDLAAEPSHTARLIATLDGVRRRVGAPFVELGGDAAESMADAVQRLNNIFGNADRGLSRRSGWRHSGSG